MHNHRQHGRCASACGPDLRDAMRNRSDFWAYFQGRRGSFGGGGPFGPSGGGRPPWSDWFGSPPPRAERGGVRYLVLDALSERPRHGYEVIQAIEERSGGSYRPSPGVIYPTLQMLEELNHARVVEQDNRKVYEITDEGRADLTAHRDEVSDFYDRFQEDSWDNYVEDFGDIMRRLGRLFKTFRRAGRRGALAPKTIKRVREIIDVAIADIETALAQERE